MVAFRTFSLIAMVAIAAALALERRAFTATTYEQFQISDGTAGKAQENAEAVFFAPFDGVDLATVSKADRDAVRDMARAAVAAEDQFNTAIAAATGADAEALERGKIANKVLKLIGQDQVFKIDEAQGKDVTADRAEKATKIKKNIGLDVAEAGKPQKAF